MMLENCDYDAEDEDSTVSENRLRVFKLLQMAKENHEKLRATDLHLY